MENNKWCTLMHHTTSSIIYVDVLLKLLQAASFELQLVTHHRMSGLDASPVTWPFDFWQISAHQKTLNLFTYHGFQTCVELQVFRH